MTKEEILLDLVAKILTKEFTLDEVRHSNLDHKQEYDFVITKASGQVDD